MHNLNTRVSIARQRGIRHRPTNGCRVTPLDNDIQPLAKERQRLVIYYWLLNVNIILLIITQNTRLYNRNEPQMLACANLKVDRVRV